MQSPEILGKKFVEANDFGLTSSLEAPELGNLIGKGQFLTLQRAS